MDFFKGFNNYWAITSTPVAETDTVASGVVTITAEVEVSTVAAVAVTSADTVDSVTGVTSTVAEVEVSTIPVEVSVVGVLEPGIVQAERTETRTRERARARIGKKKKEIKRCVDLYETRKCSNMVAEVWIEHTTSRLWALRATTALLRGIIWLSNAENSVF
jgi:hypothetical protein